jgi:glycosyltransferase involved in cell wall biosynthesis
MEDQAMNGADSTLSVLVPVYNECDTIAEILRRIAATPFRLQIITVDDGSTDGTWERLSALQDDDSFPAFEAYRHDCNRGKGAAIRTALEHASGDLCIVQDADLEYDPREYPGILQPLLDGRADAVYGSRFLGGPHRVLFFWHRVGNSFLTLLSNMLTNLNLTDMETCYKAFLTPVAKSLNLRSNRFEIEPEITAKLAKRKYRIYETPISYSGRGYVEGKKIGWKDGVKAIRAILWFRLFD